jgi:hypothetical protein
MQKIYCNVPSGGQRKPSSRPQPLPALITKTKPRPTCRHPFAQPPTDPITATHRGKGRGRLAPPATLTLGPFLTSPYVRFGFASLLWRTVRDGFSWPKGARGLVRHEPPAAPGPSSVYGFTICDLRFYALTLIIVFTFVHVCVPVCNNRPPPGPCTYSRMEGHSIKRKNMIHTKCYTEMRVQVG